MNKKAIAGFGCVAFGAAAVVGIGLSFFSPDDNSPEEMNSNFEGPYTMHSTEIYPGTSVAVGPFSDASACRKYMERHLRSVQAGMNNPAIATNPVQLAVQSENVVVEDSTRAMFKCRPAG